MSGGRFDYDQYRINNIEGIIQNILDNWNVRVNDWIEESYADIYSEATKKEFEKAIPILRKAFIYAQRIDWLLSGDDGEENFHKRLGENLKELDGRE